MPRFLEKILQSAAAAKGFTGRQADRYTYGALNNEGLMRGNVETAKGVRADAKHAAKVGAGRAIVRTAQPSAPASASRAAALASHPNAGRLGKFLHPKRAR